MPTVDRRWYLPVLTLVRTLKNEVLRGQPANANWHTAHERNIERYGSTDAWREARKGRVA